MTRDEKDDYDNRDSKEEGDREAEENTIKDRKECAGSQCLGREIPGDDVERYPHPGTSYS